MNITRGIEIARYRAGYLGYRKLIQWAEQSNQWGINFREHS